MSLPHRLSTRRIASLSALALTVACAAGVAQAQVAPSGPPRSDDRFLDARAQPRDQAAATGAPAGLAARSPAQAARVDGARRALARALGPQATLTVDPLSGTVHSLQRLDGAMTGPSSAPPAAVARRFASDNATALGLDASAVDGLQVSDQLRSGSGLTVVRFTQQVDGIPTFDSDLTVAIDHAGRVLSAGGAPRADLPASAGTPQLSAADALQRVIDQTGGRGGVAVASTAGDARRTTRFADGDTARLVLFGARRVHLAWHVTYAADSTHVYDAVVDAGTGEVLYRANLVKFANAQVYRDYPGAPDAGGSPAVPSPTVESYLSPSATTMTGPNVHAFADLNDDDVAQAGEETTPNTNYAPTTNTLATGACDAQHLCTWDHLNASSTRATNRNQNVTQTFWYANHYHDHLAAAPIGFTSADGAFQDSDPLQLNALDGASTGPDANHIDNANMLTPADGTSPRMQMYLFEHDPAGGSPFRDINGGDDAAVVYHEYTHGLSSRLITNADGTEALNTAQSGAMGEAWSDWYAMDLLAREGYVTDNAGTAGDVNMGRYTDSTAYSIRSEAMDCPVGSSDATNCAGGSTGATGGYTLGDLGKISVYGAEVHADGEIWAQTLWQLRQALITKLGGSTGADTAEQIITDAMRLSPPEPSFLDERNAIIAADLNDTGGANRDLIWEAFRSRGMGFFAATTDSTDVAPLQDFSAPPAANAPTGTISGTVTDANTGLPLTGAQASISGLDTSPAISPYFAAATGAAGGFAIPNVPQGTYPKLRLRAGGYDDLTRAVTVAAGQTTASDAQLRRDWAASPGGARITSTNDNTGAPYGCGSAALIDQSQGVGWSAENHLATYQPTIVVQLPQAITIDSFGLDPGPTCGDDSTAATKDYKLETSPDGVTWTTAANSSFTPAAAGRLNGVTPAPAAAANVRYVRLTLLSPQDGTTGSGQFYIDFSEMEIYGTTPNVLPSGQLSAAPSHVTLGQPITLHAAFSDPDSAITGYDWDVDGDGNTDATTTTPDLVWTYGATGSYTARVAVRDFRGGSGSGTTSVTVVPPTTTTTTTTTTTVKKSTPSWVLPRTGSKGRIRIRVTCKDRCRLSGTVVIDTATRRRLHLSSRTVGRIVPQTFSGTRTITVTLTTKARRAASRHHVRKLKVSLRLSAVVTGSGPKNSASRSISLRL